MYVPTYRNLSLDSPKEEFLRKFPRTTVECWICLHYGIYYLTWKVCIKLEEVLNGGYVYPIAVSGGILSDLESLYQFGRGNKYYSLLNIVASATIFANVRWKIGAYLPLASITVVKRVMGVGRYI